MIRNTIPAIVLAAALAVSATSPAAAQPAEGEARVYLVAARADVIGRRTTQAREALERAETRILNRPVSPASGGFAPPPLAARAVADARRALAARDRPGTLRAIDRALGNLALVAAPPEELVGVAAAPGASRTGVVAQDLPPVAAPPPAAVTDTTMPEPPEPVPLVTWTMRPGRWELQGARHVWVGPDRYLQRVETGRRIAGRWAWRRGEYVWEPARVVAP